MQISKTIPQDYFLHIHSKGCYIKFSVHTFVWALWTSRVWVLAWIHLVDILCKHSKVHNCQGEPVQKKPILFIAKSSCVHDTCDHDPHLMQDTALSLNERGILQSLHLVPWLKFPDSTEVLLQRVARLKSIFDIIHQW